VPGAAKLRSSWDELAEVARRTALLPGGPETREAVATACVLPKVRWAAPLAEPPPWSLDTVLMRAVLRTHNMLWCRGRYWADRVQASPTYASATQTLKQAAGAWREQPRVLWAVVRLHAANLGLRPVALDRDGLWVEPLPGADPRILQVAGSAALQQAASLRRRAQGARVFKANDGLGTHTLRLCARVQCLRRVVASRHDSEGVEGVDVEVASQPAWRCWRSQLSGDARLALRHWRAGAVASPARQQACVYVSFRCEL
jgi:hypothetical protein